MRFNKNGSRKGCIKAQHIAAALNDKRGIFYGVLPVKVSGEFVKEDDEPESEPKAKAKNVIVAIKPRKKKRKDNNNKDEN